MIDNIDPEIREIKRRLSLSNVSKILRHGDGSQLSGILHRSNLHISNAIQQLLGLKETESSVPILNSVLEEFKQKLPQ